MRRALAIGAVLWTATAANADAPEEVLAEHGCLACHSVDGTPLVGPTFLRIFDRTSAVVATGVARRVAVDDDYIRRSVRAPDSELVAGHAPRSMPTVALTDRELDAIVGALHALPTDVQPPLRTLWPLAVGALGFLFAHLGLSFHPVRSRLVARLGERRFAGVYSLVVLATFGIMIAGWVMRPFVPVWSPPSWTRWVPLAVMPIAFVLLLAGLTTANPTSAGQQEKTDRAPRGIVSITRHPSLWGFALWGTGHLVANGDLASMLLFGSVAALALAGMAHIDRRRARQLGDRWTAFERSTSIVPFASILSGRTRWDGRGLAWRVFVGLAVFGVMLALHEWEFGVSPLP